MPTSAETTKLLDILTKNSSLSEQDARAIAEAVSASHESGTAGVTNDRLDARLAELETRLTNRMYLVVLTSVGINLAGFAVLLQLFLR